MTNRTSKANYRGKYAPYSITPPSNAASMAFVRFAARVLAERDDAISVEADIKALSTKSDRSAP
ncbi:MAG: hypothetical protein OCD03_09470 [Hyphomicrobiales bacterium]